MSSKGFQWTDEAAARMERVPAGFMRNMTKMRIEEHAVNNNIYEITLKVVEEVIETSRAGMGSMMGGDTASISMDGLKHPDSIPKGDAGDESYYFCFVCGFTVKESAPEKCSNCGSGKEKFSRLEKQYLTPSSMIKLEWSENALKMLKKVPEDFRQEMTKWEIEGFCRKKGYVSVTADAVEERYRVWDGIGQKVEARLKWDDEVTIRVEKIPRFIRGMVVREMEKYADKKGEKIVSIETLDSIRDKWMDTQEFHVKWQK